MKYKQRYIEYIFAREEKKKIIGTNPLNSLCSNILDQIEDKLPPLSYAHKSFAGVYIPNIVHTFASVISAFTCPMWWHLAN